VFSNVAVLIYVFDVTSSEWETDLRYFEDNLEALRENSPEAGVWVLVNKMDLIDKEDPKRTQYADRRAEILALNERISANEPNAGPCRCFPTSIWDESLYKVSARRGEVRRGGDGAGGKRSNHKPDISLSYCRSHHQSPHLMSFICRI
jgi:hypothetical protein